MTHGTGKHDHCGSVSGLRVQQESLKRTFSLKKKKCFGLHLSLDVLSSTKKRKEKQNVCNSSQDDEQEFKKLTSDWTLVLLKAQSDL